MSNTSSEPAGGTAARGVAKVIEKDYSVSYGVGPEVHGSRPGIVEISSYRLISDGSGARSGSISLDGDEQDEFLREFMRCVRHSAAIQARQEVVASGAGKDAEIAEIDASRERDKREAN